MKDEQHKKFMKEILLFPGAFSPPHNGHVEIVEAALRSRSFDEIWIMPSGKRKDKDIELAYDHRQNIGKLFASYLRSKISLPIKLITEELNDKNGLCTHEIMRHIKSRKDVMITQLIGVDGIIKLYDVDKNIFDKEKFIVIGRDEYELSSDFPNDDFYILDKIKLEISSTQVRNMIKDGDSDYKKLIPNCIAEYIKNNKLYL